MLVTTINGKRGIDLLLGPLVVESAFCLGAKQQLGMIQTSKVLVLTFQLIFGKILINMLLSGVDFPGSSQGFALLR